jgi:hypothetical protein
MGIDSDGLQQFMQILKSVYYFSGLRQDYLATGGGPAPDVPEGNC